MDLPAWPVAVEILRAN